jgi:carbonic anhydrase/acetyltransferase-like protein (isoleucine patch superfamily)
MHIITQIGSIFVSETAVIVGDVKVGEDSSIWHNAVLRGDVAPLNVGKRVNIQDGGLLHCHRNEEMVIGDDVVLGHYAVVHCKSVGSHTLIGTRATILDGCEIGENCLIAAGTLLPPNTKIPDGSVVMGFPGTVVREVTDKDREYIRNVVNDYIELAKEHKAGKFHPYAGID